MCVPQVIMRLCLSNVLIGEYRHTRKFFETKVSISKSWDSDKFPVTCLAGRKGTWAEIGKRCGRKKGLEPTMPGLDGWTLGRADTTGLHMLILLFVLPSYFLSYKLGYSLNSWVLVRMELAPLLIHYNLKWEILWVQYPFKECLTGANRVVYKGSQFTAKRREWLAPRTD